MIVRLALSGVKEGSQFAAPVVARRSRLDGRDTFQLLIEPHQGDQPSGRIHDTSPMALTFRIFHQPYGTRLHASHVAIG